MNVAWIVLKRYAPIITFPVAVVIGGVGYCIENYLRDKKTVTTESFNVKREERRLNELITDPLNVKPIKENQYTKILDRNLSPSLSK